MAKIKVREYVAVRPPKDSTGLSVGFTSTIRQVNRLGTTLTGIGRSIGQIHTLHEFSEEWLDSSGDRRSRKIRRDDKQAHKRWLEKGRVEEKLKNKKQDQEAEDAQESDVDGEEVIDESKLKDNVRKEKGGRLKGFLGLFKAIGGLLAPFIAQLGLFAGLDWVSKNPEKVQTVIDFLVGWGKFGYKILSFGIDKFLNGVTDLMGAGDPDKTMGERVWAGVKGIGGLLVGLGGLWAASRVFMPWKLINDTRRFMQLWDIFNAQGEDQDQQRDRGNRRQQRPTRRQRTARASKAARQRYARRYGGDAARRRFQGNVKGRGPLNKMRATANKVNQGAKKLSGGLKKLTGKLGRMKGLTKGLTRIAGPAMAVLSGVNAYQDALAAGKSNSQAVGIGVGKAAGGMIGAVVGTALLGPFLGPFAPIIGGIIGDWLGGWAGEHLGPIVEKAFKKVFEFLKKAKTFIKDTIKKVLDIQLKFIKPFLDFTFYWVDLLADAVDQLNKFNDFIMNAVLDSVIETITNIISGAEFLANKAGQAWNAITGFFGFSQGGPVSNKNQVYREVHQRKRTEQNKLPKKASGGKIRAWYTTGTGGASKKLPMGKEINYGMLYMHHSQPTTFRSYGSHKIGYPKDYNFSNTTSGDPWPSSGRDVGIPTPLDAEVIYKDPTSRSGGYGNTVVIKTKQGFMQYSHLHSFGNFRPGDKIKAGTIVGGQGDTGTPGSWHLHMNAPKRLHEVFSNYISMGKPVSGSTGRTPSQEEDGTESQTDSGAASAGPSMDLSFLKGGIIGNDPMAAGQESEYFGSLESAVGAISPTASSGALNKVGSLSAFSSQQSMNRALAPGGSTIMIQQIRNAANGSTQSVIVSQPNPSPLINKC